MKELFYVPVVDYPTPNLGAIGKRIKEEFRDYSDFDWEGAYHSYWDLIDQRVGFLPLQPGFSIYRQITPESAKIGQLLAGVRKDAAKGERLDQMVLSLMETGGQLVPIDSSYMTRKVLEVSAKIRRAHLMYNFTELGPLNEELLRLMPEVGAYRGRVINRTLKEGQQGVFLEYGDTGRTLNFLGADIIINRAVDVEEYKVLTEGIPQSRRRLQ